MGDRTTAYLELSGTITYEQAEELLKVVIYEGGVDDDTWAPVTIETLSSRLVFEDANYGDINAVTGAARALGLSYVRTWDAGGGYGSGGESWDSLRAVTRNWAEHEGCVALTEFEFTDICKQHADDPVACLDAMRAHFSCPSWPTLEIIGEIPPPVYEPENGRKAVAAEFGL